MADSDRHKIEDRQLKLLRLKDQWQDIQALAQEVTQYYVPWLGRYPGDDMRPDQLHGQRMDKILDSTTTDAWEIAQNGIMSGLTPASRPWHRLQFKDPGLNKFGPARDWLEKLQNTVYQLLRSGQFYPSMHSTCGEVLAFGTGNIAKTKTPEGKVRYKDLTFGEYWISSSAGGKIDTCFRSVWMTARQIIQMFGESSVSKHILYDAQRPASCFNSYEIVHCVQPRKNRELGKINSENMPYESVWFENMTAGDLSAQQASQISSAPSILRVSGYRKFPYYVPRWKVTGSDNYGGASPAIKFLGEAKILMDIKESMTVAIHKEVDPPVVADSSLRGFNIRSGAGGITYIDSHNATQKGLEALYKVQFNIQGGKMLLDDSRTAIKNGFFNNLFLMLMNIENQADRVTAAQVQRMEAQGLLQIGPFIEHMQEDVLNDVVLGAIDEILEFPEWYGLERPPQEIQGQEFEIIYISMLAQAQRAMGKSAIDEMIGVVSNASEVFPEAVDLIDIDEGLRERADLTGVPSRMVRSEDHVQAIRQRRAQELQEKQALEMTQMGIKGAQGLAKAKTDPGDPSILTQLMGMGGEEQGNG